MRIGKFLLSNRVFPLFLRAVVRAIRVAVFGGPRLDADPAFLAFMATRAPAVFLCWHQDLITTVGYLSRWARGRRLVILTSPSRDGGVAAAGATGLGYREVARGSSKRGGAAGLLQLARLARHEEPTSVMIVADGPRPPARVLKPGGLFVARDRGLPIWLVRSSWWPRRDLARSWAHFQVPRPWADIVVRADGPILVPADLDRDGLEALRLDVEARMNALADRADAAAARLYG